MTPLTAREKEVLALLTEENTSDKEIASRLGISARTAKFHVERLIHKHGVSRRGDLIVIAQKLLRPKVGPVLIWKALPLTP